MRGFAYTVIMMSVNVTDSQREEGSIDYIQKAQVGCEVIESEN